MGPICRIDTSLPTLPDKFSHCFMEQISEILNKPKQSINVISKANVDMTQGDSEDPTVHVSIWSINVFDEERNKVYAGKLMPFISEKLNLPENRITLLFIPIESYQAPHKSYLENKG